MSELHHPHLRAVDWRAQSYDTLFADEMPGRAADDIDPSSLSMAGLCRNTARHTGLYPDVLKRRLKALPYAINEILYTHDVEAQEGEEKGLFAFTSDEHRQLVGGLVFDICKQWEITQSKHKRQPLVSAAVEAKRWLVVETAAAVMSAANKHNGFDIVKNKSDRETLVKVISCWGPNFSQQWFSGDALREWFTSQQMSPTEQTEWHEAFTPFVRKRFLSSGILNPFSALERVKYHLDVTLSDESIGAYLGWTPELTAKIFSNSVRRRLALSNISDPLKACREWVRGEIKIEVWTDKARDARLAENNIRFDV